MPVVLLNKSAYSDIVRCVKLPKKHSTDKHSPSPHVLCDFERTAGKRELGLGPAASASAHAPEINKSSLVLLLVPLVTHS